MDIRQQDHSETGSMYCIIKCIVQGNKRVLKTQICVIRLAQL